jgi:predicted nucleotidyltransferase
MTHDPFVEESVWSQIECELDAVERDFGVRILLAVESGSRAWRFPSIDSDYDVRFIYVHRRDRYLSIEPPRDVIERPITEVLDINGWDFRKSLQLLVRSNAVLLEWLTSPVRYRSRGDALERLFTLAHDTYSLGALSYHYDRMARHSFGNIQSSDGLVRLKAYCYALRPVLALRWIRHRNEPPPMDVPSLLAGLELDGDVRTSFDGLISHKSKATEHDTAARIPILDRLISETLSIETARVTVSERPAIRERADELFRSIVG